MASHIKVGKCPHCGARLRSDVRLCPACGQSIARPCASGVCPDCGAQCTDDGSCPICGREAPDQTLAGGSRALVLVAAVGALLLAGGLWLTSDQGPRVTLPTMPTVVGQLPAIARAQNTVTLAATEAPGTVQAPIAIATLVAVTPSLKPTVLAATLVATRTPSSAPSATPTAQPTPTASPTATMLEPSPTASPTAQPTATPRVHVIASGDYIEKLAAEYGVDQDVITAANGITLSSILRIGQEIVIPGPTEPAAAPEPTVDAAITGTTTLSPTGAGTEKTAESNATLTPTLPAVTSEPTGALKEHVVQEGENLGVLAQTYDVSMQEIADANGIRLNTILSIGQKLVIPGTVVTPTETATPSPNPTGTATATIEATRRPTPTWPYLAPRLLAPADDLTADSQAGAVLLNWASVGILAEDEFYQVELRCANGVEAALRFWTQATSWRLDAADLDDAGCALGAFAWRVRVVRGQDAKNTVLSLPSETRQLVLGTTP